VCGPDDSAADLAGADTPTRPPCADLLKRQLDEFEEGCLYYLATAHRHRGVRAALTG
jgi:hypothetical protein